jgi:hypothetical protein
MTGNLHRNHKGNHKPKLPHFLRGNSNSIAFTMSANLFLITAAQLAGTLSETLFYGVYLVTCMFCTQTLLRTSKYDGEAQWVRLRDVRWMAVSIAMILFLASTWDLSIGILHLFNTFVKAQESIVVFNKVTDWINIARVCFSSLKSFVYIKLTLKRLVRL